MDATDDRFDDGNTSVPGGTFYNTKAQILAKFGRRRQQRLARRGQLRRSATSG